MGNTIKNAIIIEFDGLPGSGKTTTCQHLSQKLEHLQQTSFNRYYRKTYHRNVYSILLAFRYRKILKEIKRYSKTFPTKRRKTIIYSYVSYIRMYNDFINDNKQGVLLIDQGLIQSLISLAHEDSLPINANLRKLLLCSKLDRIPIIIINCIINEKTAMRRIETRNYKGARVDTMNKTDMYRTLCNQSRNFDRIRDSLKDLYPQLSVINIDMNNSFEYNVELIIQQLQLVDVLN